MNEILKTGMKSFGPAGINKPVMLGKAQPQVPGTAMRRGMGTASGARPMTAVSGAGFSSRNSATAGSIDPSASITVTLEPKIER